MILDPVPELRCSKLLPRSFDLAPSTPTPSPRRSPSPPDVSVPFKQGQAGPPAHQQWHSYPAPQQEYLSVCCACGPCSEVLY